MQATSLAPCHPLAASPPLWTLDEMNDACFIVRDKTGQALAYVYFEDEPGRRSAAKPLTSPPTWQSCRKCCASGARTHKSGLLNAAYSKVRFSPHSDQIADIA
jgi:hypothetical protein